MQFKGTSHMVYMYMYMHVQVFIQPMIVKNLQNVESYSLMRA